MDLDIRELDAADRPYALTSWRESHKQTPGVDRVPWAYYKSTYGMIFQKLLADDGALSLGAYAPGGELQGFLVMSPGKRIVTLHWVQVKFKDAAGQRLRRRGVMWALVDAAQLGGRVIYTLKGARRRAPLPDGRTSRTLDEVLAARLANRGIIAAYEPLLSWVK